MKFKVFLLATLMMFALMIPSGKAESAISVTSSNTHHIPELLPGNSTGSQPYMAGWMDAGGVHFGATQTSVTVSFPNTDPSVIQTDNWLAGGMFVTGFDSTRSQIDYGFYTTLSLDHYGNHYFDVGVYQTYEALPPWPEGLFPWSKLLYNATVQIGGVLPSTPFTLTASWDPPSGLVYWSFTVSGNPPWTYTLPPFNVTAVASSIQRNFIVGTVPLPLICIIWAPYLTAYDFQFGVFSSYNIGHGGWNVKLEYPQYYTGGGWNDVGQAKSIGGANAYFDAVWRWGGDNYDGVNAYYYENQHSLGAYRIIFYYSGSTLSDNTLLWPAPSGGCPYVATWNGTNYVLDNNILPASELSNGTDVEDYYRLEQPLVSGEGKHSLLISESEREHSYINQVILLAVDHEPSVNIAVTSQGEILTYKNPAVPIFTVDNYGNNRLNEISLMDGNVSDPTTYFYGTPGDYLILNFGQVNSDKTNLILRTDMIKDKECILVQVRNSNDAWQTVETIIPRAYWSIEAVNLSSYVVQGQDFMVRLYWKYRHRLDYVGLDTTKEGDYEINYATLVSATHSTQGNVKSQLSNSDNIYAELIPGQQIQMDFTLPNNSKKARTYILYTEGYYYTIP